MAICFEGLSLTHIFVPPVSFIRSIGNLI